MATRVGLAKIWMTPLDWPTLKPPHWCKILGSILNAIGVIVIFVWKFSTFVTMATEVGLTQISLPQLNRQFPKTDIWRKNLDDISYKSWLIADFLMKFTDFCYHGNKGGSSENLNDSIGLADTQTPTLMQNSEIYLKWDWSYCDFCVEIFNFSFPWQQRLVWHKFHLHS